jgi:hypothetical protein
LLTFPSFIVEMHTPSPFLSAKPASLESDDVPITAENKKEKKKMGEKVDSLPSLPHSDGSFMSSSAFDNAVKLNYHIVCERLCIIKSKKK